MLSFYSFDQYGVAHILVVSGGVFSFLLVCSVNFWLLARKNSMHRVFFFRGSMVPVYVNEFFIYLRLVLEQQSDCCRTVRWQFNALEPCLHL